MRGFRMAWIVAGLALSARFAAAQQPAPDTATITMDQARVTALAQVPNNQGVKSAELKTKDGVLVYEFDIETPGSGHQEVRIDAHTGAVVADKHQGGVVDAAAAKAGQAAKSTGQTAKQAGKTVAGAAKTAGKAVAGAAANAANAVDEVLTGNDIVKAHPAISEARATRIARSAVPDASVTKTELTRRNGILAWKVNLAVSAGGHEEIRVDATTGKILDRKHVD